MQYISCGMGKHDCSTSFYCRGFRHIHRHQKTDIFASKMFPWSATPSKSFDCSYGPPRDDQIRILTLLQGPAKTSIRRWLATRNLQDAKLRIGVRCTVSIVLCRQIFMRLYSLFALRIRTECFRSVPSASIRMIRWRRTRIPL